MEVRARARFVRGSAIKLRQLREIVLRREINEALALLRHTPKRGAEPVTKVLASALGNARQQGAPGAVWRVKNLIVDEGPRMKRFRSAPMGRALPILKRMSHITAVLEEAPTQEKSDHGTES